MYFVHSYEFIPEDKSVILATTDYSSKIVCAVERDNLFGTQFHPEKSDKTGLKIIDNFYKTIMKIFPAIDIKDKKNVRLIKETLKIKLNIKLHLLIKPVNLKIMVLKIYTLLI